MVNMKRTYYKFGAGSLILSTSNIIRSSISTHFFKLPYLVQILPITMKTFLAFTFAALCQSALAFRQGGYTIRSGLRPSKSAD